MTNANAKTSYKLDDLGYRDDVKNALMGLSAKHIKVLKKVIVPGKESWLWKKEDCIYTLV